MTDFGNTHLGADDYRPLDWGRKDRAGGSSGFPIVFDDGTNTYAIAATGGELLLTISNNADPTIETHVSLREDNVRIQAPNGGNVAIDSAGGGSVSLIAKDGGGVYIEEQAGGSPAGVYIYETGGVGIFISSDGGVYIDDSGAGVQITGKTRIDFAEQTAPAAPGANNARVWAQDNGAGKTQLMCRFGSGAAIQLAIEP